MQTRSTTNAKNKNQFYKKGDRYIGNTKNGRKIGFGTYYMKNGSKIIGNWNHNKCEGTLYNKSNYRSDCFIYKGSIKNLVPHGNGVFYDCFHNKYTGTWKNGQKNGLFAKIRDETKTICYYKNDKIIGTEKKFIGDKLDTETEYRDGDQIGMISYYHEDGIEFGFAKDWEYTNQVSYILNDGNKIIAYCRNGKFCKFGKMYDNNNKFVKKVLNKDWF